MAWNDPIVREVRMNREELWKESGYDLNKFCERLKKNQSAHRSQVITKRELATKKNKPLLDA